MMFLALLISQLLAQASPSSVWEKVQNARRDSPIEVLSMADQHQSKAFFRDILLEAQKGQINQSLRTRASTLGLHLRIEDDFAYLWDRTGSAGLYVVRLGQAENIILQAPHSFFDLGTGRLVSLLLEQGPYRAAFFNTTHRYGQAGLTPEERPETPPDLAHLATTHFQAATLGASEAFTNLSVVQLHGFRSREGESAVVTSGSALQPAGFLASFRTGLSDLMEDIGPVLNAKHRPELAAKRNVQGRLLSSRSVFLHVELSKPARDKLNSNATLLEDLSQLIVETCQ